MRIRVKILVVGLMLAAVGLVAGGTFAAGDKDQKNQMEEKVIKEPIDLPPNPGMDNIGPGGRGKPGSVTKLPLDNLKAEKVRVKGGKTGWKVTIPGGRALATPAVVDGMVYVGGGFGSYEFYAFDADTGKAKWAIKVSDDGPTAAVVADGVVAFNTESCTLFVVDAKTGRMLWSQWLGDPLMSQPAIGDGLVFMAFPGAGRHYLIALGLKDGKEKWRAPIAGDIISAPVIYKDSVYLTTFDGTVYRFKTKSGKAVWTRDYQATSAPWLWKDQVFASKREKGKDNRPNESVARYENERGENNQADGAWRNRPAPYLDRDVQSKTRYYSDQKSDDSSVGFSTGPANAKLDKASANVGQSTVRGLWEYQGSRPVVYKDRLFLTQGDEIVALDPDSGKELWAHDLSGDLAKVGGHLAAPPSPAGDKLYLATVNGDVIVLSQKDGKTVETFTIGSSMRFQPSLAKGRLFVGSASGDLVSIELGDRSADGWTMWGGGPGHNGE